MSYKLLESCQFCDYVHSNQNAMLNHYYSTHFQKQCHKDLNEFFPNGSRYCSKCNYDNTYETNSNLLKALCHVCYHKLPEYIKDLKEPNVDSLAAINKLYGDQAEDTVPVLKLPDSEDEHNEDDMERNVEVAKVKRSLQILFELIFVKLKILLFTENFRFGISSEDVFQNGCQLHH